VRFLSDRHRLALQVECVLANLIYNGHVKGYISHKQRVLVLSKTNPFPLESFVHA
jgi:DNA-binding TFAR19-related protein (PDSD5 family)